MKKLITTLIAFAFIVSLNAQSMDTKVKNLMIADGTMGYIENLITETIDQQKVQNPIVAKNFWLSLNNSLQKETIPDFIELVSPIYAESFSEAQIDKLIEFYSSKTGKELVVKQPDLQAALTMPITQWLQNLNSQILNKIETRGEDVATPDEIEKFEQDFKNELGLTIVNLSELTLDDEHNPGTPLVDFGETDGMKDITKEVIVRNNTDKLISLSKPLFLMEDVITVDWGDKPLNPKEERAIKITLNSKEAEGIVYTSMNIPVDNGKSIQFGIKFNAPARKLTYTISPDSLSYEPFTSKFSKEYEFVLTNNGGKIFRISDIELDKSIAYIHFDRGMIGPDEKSTIKVLFSQESISGIEEVELILKIQLKKIEDDDFHSYSGESLKVKIK